MKAKKFNPAHFVRIHIDREKIASAFHTLATGGEWAISQPAATRRNLTWFWLDGLFASGSDNIVVTYMSVYLLALGATQAQIGLMSSISSLTAALVLLPGAWLVERLGRRMVIVLTSSGWARVALLFLALIPFLLSGNALIMVAMALSISRDAMANLSFPAWMAITGDIVPIEGRGRYFASRNFIMSITGMIAIFLVGLLITHSSGLTGFQIAFALSFVIGSGSLFSFSHIHDQPHHPSTPPIPTPAPRDETSVEQEPAETVQKKHTPLDDLRELFAYPDFIQFAGVTALWNIALNFAGPFLTVYLV
jgi:MFS family permease